MVSIFTDNAHCLFFVFAVVFGFFYSRNIWYLLDRLPDKLPKLIWILIFYYILVCPIWNINGVRMWTALHIFVYGAMPFILEKNVKKIIWCFLSIFVHFSFIIPLLILILYKLLYIRHIVNIAYLFIIYIISLSIKSINLDFLRNILSNISLLDNKNAYLSNEYIELVKNRQYAWHVILANDISYWIIQIMIFYSFYLYCKEKNRWSDSLKRLFSFSLVLYSISNIISLIPSLGRFLSLSKMFMIPLIIFVLVNFMSSSRQKIMLLFLPLIFSIIFQIRTGLDYYGIMLLLGNFFTAPFIIFDVPLIQFFK